MRAPRVRARVAARGQRRRAAVEAARRSERARVSGARLSPAAHHESSVPARAFHARARLPDARGDGARTSTRASRPRAGAFDEQQLTMWQKEAVHRLTAEAARAWLAPVIPPGLDEHAATRVRRGGAAQHRAAGGCAQLGADRVRRPAAARCRRRAGGAQRRLRLLSGRGCGRRAAASNDLPAIVERGEGRHRPQGRGAVQAAAPRAHRPRHGPGARAAAEGDAAGQGARAAARAFA